MDLLQIKHFLSELLLCLIFQFRAVVYHIAFKASFSHGFQRIDVLISHIRICYICENKILEVLKFNISTVFARILKIIYFKI